MKGVTSINNRWDYGWKVLCDPNTPWGPAILSDLIGDQYSDFEVYVGDIKNLPTEQFCIAGNPKLMDKFLHICTDKVNRKIHLEFESGNAKYIGIRMFKYGLECVEPIHTGSRNLESYVFPDSFIISVGRESISAYKNVDVELTINSTRNVFSFPVISSRNNIPKIALL